MLVATMSRAGGRRAGWQVESVMFGGSLQALTRCTLLAAVVRRMASERRLPWHGINRS